jgi:hypothetical protein
MKVFFVANPKSEIIEHWGSAHPHCNIVKSKYLLAFNIVYQCGSWSRSAVIQLTKQIEKINPSMK